MAVAFTVFGVPAPAGSKRGVPIYRGKKGQPREFTGKVAVLETSKRAVPWRQDVQAAARERWGGSPPLQGPVELVVTFYMPRPKAHLRANGILKLSAPRYPQGKPDVTKLLRAVEDALTGICWRDDAQVVVQKVRKEYAYKAFEPGAYIWIEELSPTVGGQTEPLRLEQGGRLV